MKPTILFILSDDQGAWAMHCAGNDDIITPNLDRLASEGVRFENFYCASPVCSPARASIITGEMPSCHGVHDWLCRGNVTASRYPADHPYYRPKAATSASTTSRDIRPTLPNWRKTATAVRCPENGTSAIRNTRKPGSGSGSLFPAADARTIHRTSMKTEPLPFITSM